jgi:hypothetical protein
MSNVLYDLATGWPITPHIGVGIGAMDVFDSLRVSGSALAFNDSGWQFGYHDYRYLATTEAVFRIPNTALYYRTGTNTNNLGQRNLPVRRTAAGHPPSPRAAASLTDRQYYLVVVRTTFGRMLANIPATLRQQARGQTAGENHPYDRYRLCSSGHSYPVVVKPGIAATARPEPVGQAAAASGPIHSLGPQACGKPAHQINALVVRFSQRMGFIHWHRTTLMSAFSRCRQVNLWLCFKRSFWAIAGRAGDTAVETTVDHTLMRGSEPHDR